MLTRSHVQRLRLAVELARNPGACQYVANDAPQCVIAQLATLDGVPATTLHNWGSIRINAVGDKAASDLLCKYGFGLLRDLQCEWDHKRPVSTTKRREAMNAMITQAAKVEIS